MRILRQLKILALAAIGCCPAATVSAQDAAIAPADLTNHANQAVTNIMETISLAIKGNPEAQQMLLKDYLANALLVIAVTLISYMVASWIGRVIGGIVTKKVDLTLGKFLSKAIRNLLMIIVAMVALEMNDVNVAGFAAILAAMGFAIGIALQGTLGNFAAGIMLLVFRPFKVDDYIVVADTEGIVEEIDLFTTRLNALDNRHLIIPNGEIFGSKLENYSRNSVRRVDVNVGAAYSADLEQTRAALERAVASVCDGTEAPAPQVYLLKLGSSSVDWQLRVWCHPRNYWDVRENLTAAAKKSLDTAGIAIPYPQLDVHVAGKLLAKAA